MEGAERLENTRRKVVVYTSGSWDLFHVGHLNFLERAKELGDVLIVGVLTDEFMAASKGEPIISFEQRRQIIDALRCVDVTVACRDHTDYAPIEKYGVDIRAVGPEYGILRGQREARQELKDRGIEYVILPKTPNISTKLIKKRLLL